MRTTASNSIKLSGLVLSTTHSSVKASVDRVSVLGVGGFTHHILSLDRCQRGLRTCLSSGVRVITPGLDTLVNRVINTHLVSRTKSLAGLDGFPTSAIRVLNTRGTLFETLGARNGAPGCNLVCRSDFVKGTTTGGGKHVSHFLTGGYSVTSQLSYFTSTPAGGFNRTLQARMRRQLSFCRGKTRPAGGTSIVTHIITRIRGRRRGTRGGTGGTGGATRHRTRIRITIRAPGPGGDGGIGGST